MARTSWAQLWVMRLMFPLLALCVAFFHLLPLDTLPRRWAPPDLILCLAIAWSLRRPEYVPAVSVGLTVLMADFLFYRPPGLLALLTVIGCEFLKSRVLPHRETTFAAEWFAVAVVITGITVLNRTVLNVTGVEQAPLTLSLFQTIMTIVIYPLVVVISQSVFRVRKLTPTEADALGSRT